MEKYDHSQIEKKWQEKWTETNVYRTTESKEKPKYYILDMFPYPSGAGLHVGHPKGYIATDVFARMKIMQGFNVLHPMGWDAFGLPAENYAIKNKIHPRIAVEKNIATFKSQLEKFGFTYDWSREINTSDPRFYKWTQWIFLQLFKKGLAYQSDEPINWCPGCKTGLANEDLENGQCERCGSEIERKPMRQWVLKITDYADRLLADLQKLPDWEESIKEMQKNWIGKSEGATIKFSISNSKNPNDQKYLEVFTTRLDTIYGCTYCVVAPEHSLLRELKEEIKNWEEVERYLDESKKKTDLDRMEAKEKTGVELKGVKVVNPFNGKELPLFVADYVLAHYGTGAVMAVPAHDERDFEFAKKYNLPIKVVINPENGGENQNDNLKPKNLDVLIDDGILINSEKYNGLSSQQAREELNAWLEENNLGGKKINYKLQDWVFSRQRYWGEPIPIIHCEKCGAAPVPETELPVLLPEVEKYEPTGTGESPLADIAEWVNVKCPVCGAPAKRETNTMPQWAGSSWYYLRFIDPTNEQSLADKEKDKYWSPVDFYVGGAEHATRHLIYARFWHKFLYDIGAVNYEEPFIRLQHVGLILAEDGRKMSKRWGNVINPDEVIDKHGADALRVYEMFMGPFSQAVAWNTKGLIGARKFLDKLWRLSEKTFDDHRDNQPLLALTQKTIKKVGRDIDDFKLNTAVSSLMILVNELGKVEKISNNLYESLLKILAPFAPHLAEELWEKTGHRESIFKEKWPQYDQALIADEEIEIPVMINGKLRDALKIAPEITEEEIKKLVLQSAKVKKWLAGQESKKFIYIKGKVVNIVV